MAIKEFFEVSKRYRTWSYALIAVGIVSLIFGYIFYGASSDMHEKTRFWAALLQNSVYFLLVLNACAFFVAATTLAWGGWQVAFQRVPEALASAVPVVGGIALIVLLSIIFGGPHMSHVFHWNDPEAVAKDEILKGKSGFLNPTFFTIWTILTIGLWSVLGYKLRQLSLETDRNPNRTVEESRNYVFRSTVWSAIFIVWFALTVMSVTPWFWLKSIDPHWYSTMYSWFTFASTWQPAIALIILFVVYLKNRGYLNFTNEEHLHDLGKFLFAFSIFWAYLWFSQLMLIWYANIPEETIYYQNRIRGSYSGIFWFSFIINFLSPLLILMKRNTKRHYATITIMALTIIFGQWLNFHQMVFASLLPEHVVLNLFDFGIALGFIGTIMLVTGRTLAKHPLEAKNHPFIKESIIHHT
jgi:hypothetical protein